GSDAQVGSNGWYVDDIEIMDVFNYNGEACVTADQGNQACAIAGERGTIVESNGVVNAEELAAQTMAVSVFPNPATDYLNVAISAPEFQEVNISLTTADGKVLSTMIENVGGDNHIVPINVGQLAAGFYFVRVQTEKETIVEKIIIE
ncbi:MAG: T9SS type A sorting domain-containing protein, partial [Bacteroidota bacterium]